MYKGECLNPQLAKFLCELGHTDKICICDAGLPIPSNVQRIDLAWKKNSPKWLEVCEFVNNNVNIEKIYIAKELCSKNQELYDGFKVIFKSHTDEFIKHSDFKKEVGNCKGVIRTGEFTSFANYIIKIGVDFKD